MAKEHHFNIEVAEQYGVDSAIILYNLEYWLEHNRANNKNIHDGYVWTFNSARAFSELFPYWTSNKIQKLLKKMEDQGLIIVGNYNKKRYDKTKWYTTAKYLIKPNGLMDSAKRLILLSQTAEPIPYNKHINKHINKHSTTFQEKSAVPVELDRESLIIAKAYQAVFNHPHRAITRDDYEWDDLGYLEDDELYEVMVEYMQDEIRTSRYKPRKPIAQRCTADYINKVQGRWK